MHFCSHSSSHGNDLLSHGNDLLSHGNDLLSHDNDLLSHDTFYSCIFMSIYVAGSIITSN